MKKRFNIQLFALDQTTTTSYTGIKNVDEAHKFVDRALKESIYEDYTLHQYADAITLPKNNGQKMVLRKLSKYVATMNELSEGVLPDADAPMKIYEYQVDLKDYGGYTKFTDKIDIYALNNGWCARISKNQGSAVGEKLQDKLRNAFYSSPNRFFAGATYATSLTATRTALVSGNKGFQLDDLNTISAIFKRQHVKPYDGRYYVCLISPEVKTGLLSLATVNGKHTFVEVMQYTDIKPMFEGEIGIWGGFRIVEDPAITSISSTYANVHGCLCLGKYNGEKGLKTVNLEGLGKPETIIKDTTSGGVENALNQVGSVGWKMMGFGTKVLYAEAVMVYECYAPAPATEWSEVTREAYTTGTNGQGTTVEATTITGQYDGTVISG